jgi:hypothetical protein
MMPHMATLTLNSAHRSALDSIQRYISEASATQTRRKPPRVRAADAVVGVAPEKLKFIVHPLFPPAEAIDLTHRIVELIASELWKLRQGNDLLNWLEAERLFEHTLKELARAERTQQSEEGSARGRSVPRKRPNGVRQSSPRRAKHAHIGAMPA